MRGGETKANPLNLLAIVFELGKVIYISLHNEKDRNKELISLGI